ncbi:hypothetical protein CDAR_59531 [Caerostris darwini]|uniref:Uncharacterized protein n=1 Tax=Caerostris darwini TaxID=1538125 RepID=A0AAV4X440_9ARAC|nr:hypothetical protein CDAR_59531 [Caerostris darwini]
MGGATQKGFPCRLPKSIFFTVQKGILSLQPTKSNDVKERGSRLVWISIAQIRVEWGSTSNKPKGFIFFIKDYTEGGRGSGDELFTTVIQNWPYISLKNSEEVILGRTSGNICKTFKQSYAVSPSTRYHNGVGFPNLLRVKQNTQVIKIRFSSKFCIQNPGRHRIV